MVFLFLAWLFFPLLNELKKPLRGGLGLVVLLNSRPLAHYLYYPIPTGALDLSLNLSLRFSYPFLSPPFRGEFGVRGADTIETLAALSQAPLSLR
jgi:hypothetical protein